MGLPCQQDSTLSLTGKQETTQGICVAGWLGQEDAGRAASDAAGKFAIDLPTRPKKRDSLEECLAPRAH